jgi:formiminotetrahydrofolate cyclodeaminase
MTYSPALCEECHKRIITEEEETEARNQTIDEILKEGINVLFDIARQNELSEDGIDSVLRAIIDDRATDVRSTFKLH